MVDQKLILGQHCIFFAWPTIKCIVENDFFCIWTKYGEILHISPYSVRVWENTDGNNSEYGQFLHSEFVDTIFFATIIVEFTLGVIVAMIPIT